MCEFLAEASAWLMGLKAEQFSAFAAFMSAVAAAFAYSVARRGLEMAKRSEAADIEAARRTALSSGLRLKYRLREANRAASVQKERLNSESDALYAAIKKSLLTQRQGEIAAMIGEVQPFLDDIMSLTARSDIEKRQTLFNLYAHRLDAIFVALLGEDHSAT